MKKLYRRFIEISARLTRIEIEERAKDGTLGLGEYFYLVANGFMFFFSLLIVAIIFGPIYFLIVRPYKWAARKVVNWTNEFRINVPR